MNSVNKKKKLLITLGCSLTEGVGCYGDLPENSVIEGKDYEKFRNRFHKYSWPSQLVKLLNYDKLINMGFGGSSTSGQLKVFMQKYEDEYFKDYEVLCLWCLPEPLRLSFYNSGHIENVQLTNEDISFTKGYLEQISDITIDPLLDQLFYVKTMRQICENKNWNFLAFHNDSMFINYINKLDKNDCWLHDSYFENMEKDYLSPICDHPNEKGYKIIALKIYENIKNKNYNLVNNENVNKIEMIYNGDSLNYTYLLNESNPL